MKTSYQDPTQQFDQNFKQLDSNPYSILQEVNEDTYPIQSGRVFEGMPPAQPKKKKYNWAFFLCSMFIGLGMTASTEIPGFLFAGLGLGFLFFVDPIYEKVMAMFEK